MTTQDQKPQQADHNYSVTVLVDGKPKEKHFPSGMTVLESTRQSLPEADKNDVANFTMVDTNLGKGALTPESTLEQAGVRDGHVLSITKKAGGGGTK